MKTIKFIFALFTIILCFCSCESTMNNGAQSEIDLESKEMSISESTIDMVLSFVKEVYPQKYKTLSLTKEVLKPEFVTNVSYEKNTFFAPTKDNANMELDTLLSVINFGNDEGFAIVSTKDNQILAVTESGDLSVEDLTKDYSNEDFENNPKAVISSYVTNFIIGPTIPVGPAIPDDSINMGYVVTGPWVTETQIHPLVQIKIGQDAPYNNYCPIINSQHCPAGCAAIAVIQIMSANQYPNTIGGITYSWNTIINRYKTHAATQTVLAQWIRTIGDECKMAYSINGSGTEIDSVKKCLLLYSRYKNINIVMNPDYEDIYSMLQKRTPLYYRGVRTKENGQSSGHAWVVDGCIYQKQCVQLYDHNDVLTGEYYEIRNYVHCNWGWNGSCDGYYITNVFNLSNGAPIPDEGTTGTSNRHYSQYLKAITYDFE